MEILGDLLIIFLVSGATIFFFRRIGVPTLVGFLVGGILVGPHGLGLVANRESVEILAEVGVILLLFGVGLETSLARLGQMRRLLLLGGGLQFSMTALVGGLLLWPLLGWRVALFSGFLLSMSSTAIVLKMLADRGELHAPHGRAAISILLFQDFLIFSLILVLPALGGKGGGGLSVALSLATAVAVVGGILLVARWLVPKLLFHVARVRSRELFLVSLIVVILGIAWVTSEVGLSLALGAFLAGLAVSESEHGLQALAEIEPLRDSFNGLFFVSIGMLLDLNFLARHPPFHRWGGPRPCADEVPSCGGFSLNSSDSASGCSPCRYRPGASGGILFRPGQGWSGVWSHAGGGFSDLSCGCRDDHDAYPLPHSALSQARVWPVTDLSRLPLGP